ncbi:MAG: DUF3127 domain-containing protein [Bacteroidia bacterium]|nr:DUF3127 domain-containing protein [Bacteroidia bacterium]
MALDITGKIIQKLPITRGTSKAGKDWEKQEFIIETQETYPKKICIGLMGEKTRELEKFNPGQEVKVSLNIESREYQGKWYTNINAWRIEAAGASQGSAGAPMDNNDPYPVDNTNEAGFSQDASTDDLPF